MTKLRKLAFAAARRLFLLLPVAKNKIVFCSYYGRGYSDSPKAIAQALLDSGKNLRLQWLVKDDREAQSLPPSIEPVIYDSLHRIYTLSTARVWVDNCRKYERFKRKNQFYLQTWHGFALKRIEADVADVLEPEYIRGCKQDSRQCDLVVSGSAFMTGLYRNVFWYDGEVAEFGTPRNDIFFTPQPQTRQKVLDCFGLSRERKLVLYAPTFRADHSVDAYRLEARGLLEACRSRFGGQWSLLARLHPNVASQSGSLFAYDGEQVLDATLYPDMQELLCACDLLVTDYSSCMFDFALSGKPCLRFALDIEAYRQDRGFYFPLDEVPFPLADSNEALQNAVMNFDQAAYEARWQDFARANGFREDGHASQRCAQWILDRIN
ncbi:MAG: CDP-glycerol glycerophosphotransferase family protein [Faecousia sp.]